MTSFKITNDDLGVRGLQENNKKPVLTGPVMPVKASNPVHASPENLPIKAGTTDRRGADKNQSPRRQMDRRKMGTHVLLDTRSSHDRRTKTGRSDDADIDDAIATLRGIDEVI